MDLDCILYIFGSNEQFIFYRHTSFYCAPLLCASQILCFFFFLNKFKSRPSTSKEIRTCFIIRLALLRWCQTKPTIPPRYACTESLLPLLNMFTHSWISFSTINIYFLKVLVAFNKHGFLNTLFPYLPIVNYGQLINSKFNVGWECFSQYQCHSQELLSNIFN